MKQRVIIYACIFIFIASLIFFVRLNNYETLSGLSIQSLPPEQDLEGYGEDFTLSIENIDLLNSKAIVNYNLKDLTGNSQKILLNIELYDNELIVSKSMDLIISANEAEGYTTSISLPGQRIPNKIVVSASGSSSYRKSILFVKSPESIITGNVISERRSEVGFSFVVFFILLLIFFFFFKRRHLKNKSKHFASRHEDNLITIHN